MSHRHWDDDLDELYCHSCDCLGVECEEHQKEREEGELRESLEGSALVNTWTQYLELWLSGREEEAVRLVPLLERLEQEEAE